MNNPYLVILTVGVALVLVLQILLLLRRTALDVSPVLQEIQSVEKAQERVERAIREEIARNRDESATAARDTRVELANSLKALADSLNRQITTLIQSNDQKLDSLRSTVEQRLASIQEDGTNKLEKIRSDSSAAAQKAREEVTTALRLLGSGVDDRLKQIQSDSATTAKQLREEVVNSLKSMSDSISRNVTAMTDTQQNQLTGFSTQLVKLTESNQQKLDGLKDAVEARLKALQDDNSKQLDQMRATVDEKLQGTLEKRLGESFKLVSERLEQVFRGLGEMQNLATGVGDLKKVLTNVKTRGTWGEVQLGAMLEQVLPPDQYAKNVAVKGDGERVEFAIKLPGRGDDKEDVVWLPIDAKFPVEDYQRLVEAQEKADPDAAEKAARQLEVRIKQCAKDICEKYIAAPKTTDFGILFLPTEGLFAEVLRRVGLPEFVQRECRVVIAGPTTLWSILNSLQMGFRTMAIQKRSSDVWNVLALVKTEFGKFGVLLDNVKKKLDGASSTIDEAARKSRTIEKKLRSVQELPANERQSLLQAGQEELELDPEETSD